MNVFTTVTFMWEDREKETENERLNSRIKYLLITISKKYISTAGFP